MIKRNVPNMDGSCKCEPRISTGSLVVMAVEAVTPKDPDKNADVVGVIRIKVGIIWSWRMACKWVISSSDKTKSLEKYLMTAWECREIMCVCVCMCVCEGVCVGGGG